MIIVLCFILLFSSLITIDVERSTDLSCYQYFFPFINTSFLTIYKDELDNELYNLSIQLNLYFIYKDEYLGFYIEKEFIFESGILITIN